MSVRRTCDNSPPFIFDVEMQCPMCRAACHGGAGDCGTNLAMVSIITSQFGSQYEQRKKEVRMKVSSAPLQMASEFSQRRAMVNLDVCHFKRRGS